VTTQDRPYQLLFYQMKFISNIWDNDDHFLVPFSQIQAPSVESKIVYVLIFVHSKHFLCSKITLFSCCYNLQDNVLCEIIDTNFGNNLSNTYILAAYLNYGN
jgi:hypothetical protein